MFLNLWLRSIYDKHGIIQENKKLREQNARLLSILKTDEDIDWHTDDLLNDMFPDEEEM